MPRPIPQPVAVAWQRTTTEPPLAAVAASRSLHQGLARWQVELVSEAVASGASWEDIGDALGTTRQAAWARFRHAMDEGGQPPMEQQTLRQRLNEIKNAGVAQLREVEDRWNAERTRLRDELVQTQHKLAEAQRLHVQRQREARDELRRAIATVRREMKPGWTPGMRLGGASLEGGTGDGRAAVPCTSAAVIVPTSRSHEAATRPMDKAQRRRPGDSPNHSMRPSADRADGVEPRRAGGDLMVTATVIPRAGGSR